MRGAECNEDCGPHRVGPGRPQGGVARRKLSWVAGVAPRPGLRFCLPAVPMVQAADARSGTHLCHVSGAGLHRTGMRTILCDPEMSTILQVVFGVSGKQPTEMAVIEDDDMVEQLSSHAAHKTLRDISGEGSRLQLM